MITIGDPFATGSAKRAGSLNKLARVKLDQLWLCGAVRQILSGKGFDCGPVVTNKSGRLGLAGRTNPEAASMSRPQVGDLEAEVEVVCF
jgi:hypothetical protein